MGFFAFILIASLVVAFSYLIYRYFKSKALVATDELFSQNGITIHYANQTITIGKKSYDVNKVTGVSIRNHGNSTALQVEVDDIKHPIHRAVIIGSANTCDQFMQRVCVALRKAGGPSFI